MSEIGLVMATPLKVTDSLGAMAQRYEIFENVRKELAKLGEQKNMSPEISGQFSRVLGAVNHLEKLMDGESQVIDH
jgi:hypothetical protein